MPKSQFTNFPNLLLDFSSTKDSTASSMNALSAYIAELQLFLFFFAQGGVSFLYSVSAMAKNLREPTLQKPKLWKNKQKTISEKPQCILSG